MKTAVAYNLARLVPALLSLFIAILYLDVFTFKGLRLFVRRADPATWRGFEQPYIVHRIYGIALAAPYLVNVYMLARAAGLLGEAAKEARRGRTRVGLLYEKYFGYEGSHFVWKVFCFQIVEVALQAAGKIPLFLTYVGGGDEGATFWFVYVFVIALLLNVLYPSLLLRSRLVRYQRDVSFVVDTFLDVVYAVTPFMFLFSGVRSCVEIKQCVGCTRQFFTKSFLADDAAVLAETSGNGLQRHTVELVSRRWRGGRRGERGVKF